MSKERPFILISNDDAITSKGIRTLVEIMSEIGDVLVVAPNSPQSGMGHAITIHTTLKIIPSDIFGANVEAYECSGTPADCIKLGKYHIKTKRSPDLVVSGINHGSNTSISILYSGTMSAAIEGAIEGAPAIGFSLCDYQKDADFSHIKEYVKKITLQVLQTGLPKGIALNVNFPKIQEQAIQGIKICRQARARWQDKFEERSSPYGEKYLWATGSFVNHDLGHDTDEWAVKNNFVSVVPCVFDLTAHRDIAVLNDDWEILR